MENSNALPIDVLLKFSIINSSNALVIQKTHVCGGVPEHDGENQLETWPIDDG
jgi:hypothetical protein